MDWFFLPENMMVIMQKTLTSQATAFVPRTFWKKEKP